MDDTDDNTSAESVQIPWDTLGGNRGVDAVANYLDGIDAALGEERVCIVDVEPAGVIEGGNEGDQLIVAAHGSPDDEAVFHIFVVDYTRDGDGVAAIFINHSVLGKGAITVEGTPYVSLDDRTLGVGAYVRDAIRATPGVVSVAWTPDGYWRYSGAGLFAEMNDD